MNKIKLDNVFQDVKRLSEMDYAVINTDIYGDCNTCVLDGLSSQFGVESTGIYAKVWLHGMNACSGWENLDTVFISHDITEEQAKIMIEVFKKNGYEITPEKYNKHECFLIREK